MGVKINVAAAVIREGQKILASQRDYGEFAGRWEFPGGKVETGEAPWHTIKRGVHRAMGAEVQVGRFILAVEYETPDYDLTMDCFWCELPEGEGEELRAQAYAEDSVVHLADGRILKWMDKEDLRKAEWMPADEEVIDIIEASL